MHIKAKVLAIILIFINNFTGIYSMNVNKALIREVQQALITTFGNRYPLSCYEQVTHLLLQLEQQLQHSLRVESSECAKKSLLYTQRLLSEFDSFSYKVHDNFLQCERDIAYISFLIQHTYLFFERHAPLLLQGRNRPAALNQYAFDNGEQSFAHDNQNTSYETTRFIMKGTVGVMCALTLYIILKRYFLSSMAYRVQKCNHSMSILQKKNNDVEKVVESLGMHTSQCEEKARLIQQKLDHLKQLLEDDTTKVLEDAGTLKKSYYEAISCSIAKIKEEQKARQEKVGSIEKLCPSINEQTTIIKKRRTVLSELFEPYKTTKSAAEDLGNFFRKQ